MNVGSVMTTINKVKENAYDDELIIKWINDCDEQIYNDVILTHEKDDNTPDCSNRYPIKNTDTELLTTEQYSKLYIYYVMSQIDFYNGEYDRYVNSMTMFNSELANFKAYYIRTHKPLGCSNIKMR